MAVLPLSAYCLVTSNADKLREFRGFGLPLRTAAGLDLPEVDGDQRDVILHKALAAGAGHIVEDTALDVDGAEVGVNVRWLLTNLRDYDGRAARWTVYLGLNDGEAIEVYHATVPGRLAVPARMPETFFGFDPVFVPDGAGGLSLHDLADRKADFSPRRMAVHRLLDGRPDERVPHSDIAPWTGAWQAKR